jgi:hypothetical protein
VLTRDVVNASRFLASCSARHALDHTAHAVCRTLISGTT